MSWTIGRNDPCHCGSGNKYKRCHLQADERQRSAAWSAGAGSAPGIAPIHIGPDHDARDLKRQLEALAAQAPPGAREKYEAMMADLEPLIAYEQRKAAVDAASTILEQHREAFSKQTADKSAYVRKAAALFGEETFASLRFTAAEVRAELEKVGHVPGISRSHRAGQEIRAAILSLCTRQRRRQMAMDLLSHLPEYVEARRYMDGWMIQALAFETLERETESNAFLFHMFAFGYDAWINQQREADLEFLRQAGIDPARVPCDDPGAIEALARTRAADPTVRATMDEFLQRNPAAAASSSAKLEGMQLACLEMLEADHGREFLLSDSELEPWLAKFLNAWNSAIHSRGITVDSNLSKETVAEIMQVTVHPVVSEMVQSVFTQQRISELTSKLRQFQNQQFAAGDRLAAAQTFAALASFQQETQSNPFLKGICFLSLRDLISRLAQEAPVPKTSEPSPGDRPACSEPTLLQAIDDCSTGEKC